MDLTEFDRLWLRDCPALGLMATPARTFTRTTTGPKPKPVTLQGAVEISSPGDGAGLLIDDVLVRLVPRYGPQGELRAESFARPVRPPATCC